MNRDVGIVVNNDLNVGSVIDLNADLSGLDVLVNVGLELVVADGLGILSLVLTGDGHRGNESASAGRSYQLLGQFLDQGLFLGRFRVESFATAL